MIMVYLPTPMRRPIALRSNSVQEFEQNVKES